MPFFRRANVQIVAGAESSDLLLEVDAPDSTFELPDHGVYSLEGDNQSGKSLLIKALLSVCPQGLEIRPGEGDVLIGGRTVMVRHIRDAMKAGIVAVFQDDVLIPSMTVEEQVLLRHATPKLRTLYAWAFELFHLPFYTHTMAESMPWLRRILLKKVLPHESDLHPQYRIRSGAEQLLVRYGFADILNKYPRELSGGAKAVARLVQAQLTPGIRLLCLDEAFAGVDERTLPSLVEALLDWRQETKTAILVVTHNAWERQLWNPVQTFTVSNRKVRASTVADHKYVISALPAKQSEFRVYFQSPGAVRLPFPAAAIVIAVVDKAVANHPATQELLDQARHSHLIVREVLAGEQYKTFEHYSSLLTDLAASFSRGPLCFLIIGGGVTLNSAGFVAATLHRGRYPTFLVPTTVMALADVAVGSKTGVNVHVKGKSLKHTVGVYHNPSGILVDKRYLDTLPQKERLRGLSECLKHAVLQDPELYEDVVHQIKTGAADTDKLFEVAHRTMVLKSRVLRADPFEENIGRILLFGHLHAHGIERALGLTASHGDCVYLGILCELYLADSPVYTTVRGSLEPLRGVLFREFVLPSVGLLENAYAEDPYDSYRSYQAIAVSGIGCYSDPSKAILRTVKVEWHDIRAALEAVSSALELKSV